MSEMHVDAYRSLQERVRDVVGRADANRLASQCPATPEWTARDVLAHLVGVTDDVVNGRLDGVASDAWTQAQVDARADADAGALLDEWDKNLDAFLALLDAVPDEIAGQALFDAATHEHDLRHALAAPGARDSDAVAIGWAWLVDARTRGAAPALRYVTDAGEMTGGAGDVVATVEAPRFELVRATAGRRSASEVSAYRWLPASSSPNLLLAAPIFRMRAEPLDE